MTPFLQVSSLGGGPAGHLTAKQPVPDADPGQVVFTSSQDWSVPNGVTAISICCVGGGGGGGYTDGYGEQPGTGGGGGALAWVNDVTVSPGQIMEITVGSAGEGGQSTSEAAKIGDDGGDSLVKNESSSDTIVCHAEGGEGGGFSE